MEAEALAEKVAEKVVAILTDRGLLSPPAVSCRGEEGVELWQQKNGLMGHTDTKEDGVSTSTLQEALDSIKVMRRKKKQKKQ